jgi:PAS domain S-box-containing protein
MIKILLIAPYQKCKELADKVFLENNEQELILESIHAIGVKIVDTLHLDYDAVIARGVTASALREILTDTVVIDLPVTGYDVVRAVDFCRREYGSRYIAVMGSSNMIYGVQSISDILGVCMETYKVLKEEDAEKYIMEARAKKVDAVIGGAMAVQIAQERGLNAAMIETGEEAILQAIEEAVRTAKIAQQTKKVTERVKAILDYAYEGVVAVDEKGLITVFNKTAEQVIEVKAEEALGKYIRNIIPGTGLLRVLETGKDELGELETINANLVATNRAPVKVKETTVGAVATFQKVSRLQELEGRIREKLYTKGLTAKYTFKDIVGNSPEIRETIEMTRKFSQVDSNVLIVGETGTGKELLAQSCHNASARRNGPFVAVNCAALPENLLESELFGYVEGAFTGAARGGKPGLFELAHKGTIFLDEISEIPLKLQGRLLRVLQEREIMRLGHDRVIPIDVRVLSATNQDLRRLADEGKFRLDLLYRLDVLQISIAPLRQRKEDILVLIHHFIKDFNLRFRKNVERLTDHARQLLLAYTWPGNIRELCNICERLVVLAEGQELRGEDVSRLLNSGKTADWSRCQESSAQADHKELGRPEVEAAILQAGGNKAKAARILGISRTTLWRKLQEYTL